MTASDGAGPDREARPNLLADVMRADRMVTEMGWPTDNDAVRPQVLTTETPEPPRPWRVVPLDGVCENYWASGPVSWYSAEFWESLVARFNGRPVYVISGQAVNDRG